MSNAEDRYRDADELARDIEEENRLRREKREVELARLRRLHTEEAAEDRQVSRYTRAMRAVRKYQLQQEPEQVRRSLIRLTMGTTLLPLTSAAMLWLIAVSIVTDQGGPGWVGHVLGLVYTVSFIGALAWHARSRWQREAAGLPTIAAWTLLLAPVLVLCGLAALGWIGWVFVAITQLVCLMVGFTAIYMTGEIPRQYRKILAAKGKKAGGE
ncbi:hypothetical protein [Nocardiopsis sp. JB363]|uniref:hypothetical protein n=1 Tax=Nocardiopsis sp. JB363 TaxID=1434837 RepID=UPI000B351290|nr:hypothetical protein [Nocardiopsis sp. JB363]